ncbi:MAG TPA: hypothetical protein ENK28_12780 [Aliiroseovarius sp.]|nr:hypothetical protein [Aliiroseovarius sp.]
MIWMVWWFWAAAALGLAILEVLAPGFIFLGFAIGALGLGIMLWFGITTSLPWLLVIGAVFSLVAWFGLRAVFGIRKGQVKIIRHDINEE